MSETEPSGAEATGTQSADSLVGLLDQLILPPEPAPVSMMPETAGWWILAAIVGLALAALGWRAWGRWRANAYRRAALAELDKAGEDVAAIAAVLRRTALAAWPRTQVAGLVGEEWVAFLRSSGDFPEALAWRLVQAPYRAQEEDEEGVSNAAEAWIRHHRVTPPEGSYGREPGEVRA